MGFPYSTRQIEAAIKAGKHPRDWEPFQFTGSGEHSRRCDMELERDDGKEDRLRLIVQAGRVDVPTSYRASLLLENARIRGIDHHAIARSHFYKEISPKGWHEDLIDPNLEPGDKQHHRREALPDFSPSDLEDFLRRVSRRWNIQLPPASETLL